MIVMMIARTPSLSASSLVVFMSRFAAQNLPTEHSAAGAVQLGRYAGMHVSHLQLLFPYNKCRGLRVIDEVSFILQQRSTQFLL